ncbi:MAG: hypothetical protein ACTSSG_14020 [Candidatus Heimdallarchaeaceae archaeon]
MFVVRAIIKDSSGRTWEESFEVSSMETAEEEVKKIIANFNESLQPYEQPRAFVKLIIEYNDELLKKYCRNVIRKLTREAANTYGNLTVKENLKKWEKTITHFLSLKNPRKMSYENLLEVLCHLPQEFRDEGAIEYLKDRIKERNK